MFARWPQPSLRQDTATRELHLVFGATGKQLIGLGVFRHAQGLSAIQSTLLQEGDGRWKVLAFTIQTGTDAKPWGACLAEPP